MKPEPRTVFNPYHEYLLLDNSGPVTYEESLVNYQTSTPYQPQSFALPSRAKVFDDPWTPVDQRVPLYPPGYTAFSPSPGPAGEFYAQYGTSVPPSPETRKSSQSREKHSRSGRTSSSKGKENAHSPGWEHVVISKDGFRKVYEIPKEETRGCRKGKLDSETAEKARRIRKKHACWSCWVGKTPVSTVPSPEPSCTLITR